MDVPRPGLPPELGEVTVRALLESAPDALVIVNERGTIVLANSQAETLFGYDREELVGQKVEMLVPQDRRAGHPAHRDAFMESPRTRPMGAALDLRARRKDGSEIPVEISLSPLATSKGRFVSAAIRDVTGRRKAEQKFRALLEGAPDAMVIVDATGTIVLANAQAERLFGYSRVELVGMGVENLVPEAVRAGHAGHRERFMADPKARPMGAALDLRARRKDGSEIPVEISLAPLDTEGERLVMAAIRDITDRRRMEKERQEGRDRQRELEHLRQVDQFKTTFLNTAAHELRTPLLPVKAQFHLLKRRLASSGDRETIASVDILDRNITRLSSLVEDLLDAARYQAGRVNLRLEEIDLAALAAEAVDSFRQAAKERSITVALQTPGARSVVCDRKRILQVLYNLLSNAVKFTRDGGAITVGLQVGPDEATVRITDTGIGLAPAEIPRLFQPFAQLQESMVAGQRGSGLGLYVSRGFVEAHGGRIWVESAGPGKGSEFIFTIPTRSAPGTATPSGPATAGAGAATTTDGSPAVG
ncbi:MAG: sensor histidine kinase [Thermoplasmatota archaeon]